MENQQTKQAQRTRCEVYSRVVGWIVPVQQWNEGKKSEFVDRTTYDKQLGDENGGCCGCQK
jgi:ribonucleoside-triphosphate reductase